MWHMREHHMARREGEGTERRGTGEPGELNIKNEKKLYKSRKNNIFEIVMKPKLDLYIHSNRLTYELGGSNIL